MEIPLLEIPIWLQNAIDFLIFLWAIFIGIFIRDILPKFKEIVQGLLLLANLLILLFIWLTAGTLLTLFSIVFIICIIIAWFIWWIFSRFSEKNI